MLWIWSLDSRITGGAPTTTAGSRGGGRAGMPPRPSRTDRMDRFASTYPAALLLPSPMGAPRSPPAGVDWSRSDSRAAAGRLRYEVPKRPSGDPVGPPCYLICARRLPERSQEPAHTLHCAGHVLQMQVCLHVRCCTCRCTMHSKSVSMRGDPTSFRSDLRSCVADGQ